MTLFMNLDRPKNTLFMLVFLLSTALLMNCCGNDGPQINVGLASIKRQEVDFTASNGKQFVRSFHFYSLDKMVCTPARSYTALLKDACAHITIPLCIFSLKKQVFGCTWADGKQEAVTTSDTRMDKNFCTYDTDYQTLIKWLEQNC